MTPLLPSCAELYPAHSAYMARTDLFETRMLGYTAMQLDTATSMLMGVLNGHTTVRHEAATGPVIADLFHRAGIFVDEDLFVFQTENEARIIADRLIDSGKKLFWPYPTPAGYYPDSAQLVSPGVYSFLNAKQNLAKLVPQEHLAHQQILDHETLAGLVPSAPACLKAAGDAATGWGYTVFYCPDRESFSAARKWFLERRDDIPAVLVEEWVDVECCWCVGLAISDSKTICFGGAEQLFSSPGKQSGSMMDSGMCFPAAGELLAVRVGEVARQMGFRGVAGIDIGLARDGRLIVFDPNFRIASSTSQLLFHPAASKRVGLPVSQSFQVTPPGAFENVASKLHRPMDEGWFVPTRFFDGEKHPLSGGKHIITGFVLGTDRNATAEASKKLQAILLT